MKSFQSSIIPVFLVLFSFQIHAQQKTSLLEISKFVDGDTFWVLNEKGQKEKILLNGVDTPEARRTGNTEVEFVGKEASEYLKRIFIGRKVRR